jgi:outer membrane PBP1 activator LpoA protein
MMAADGRSCPATQRNRAMKMITLLLLALCLSACGKNASNPADEMAKDIKAMDQRGKTRETLKQLEQSQQATKAAADKVGEGSEEASAKN